MPRIRLLSCLLVVLATAGLGTAMPSGDGYRAAVEHLTGATIAEAGRTRVIHFEVTPAPETDMVLDGVSGDPAILEIARPPMVIAGSTLGTVRVRGLQPGTTTLEVGGEPISVEVVAPRTGLAGAANVPRIVGPATGAAIWGEVSVGIEVRPRPFARLRRVVINVGDRMTLRPYHDTRNDQQPYRALRFKLDTRDLPEGPIELRPVAIDENFDEQVGPAVWIRVVKPSDEAISSGEAEWRYVVDEDMQPFGGGDQQPDRIEDDEASGGAYARNNGPFPPVSFPVVAVRPGWYQMMLVARGTRAAGALPMVAITSGNIMQPLTNGRILGEDWHRVAIGIPFRLDAGRHVLSPYFANDFNVPGVADRNLHLDWIEVARVGYADPAHGMSSAGTIEQTVDDPYGLAPAPIRIAFDRPMHGGAANGAIEVRGRVRSTGDTIAPVVTLHLNGEPFATQRSWAPRFWVDPGALVGGANRVQLIAQSAQGPQALTPVQTVDWSGQGSTTPARRHIRLTAHEELWAAGLGNMVRDVPDADERRAAQFPPRRAVMLDLDETLAGRFDLVFEARGADAGLRVTLETRRGAADVGSVTTDATWSDAVIDDVDLALGPKRLVIRHTGDGGDVDVQALTLSESTEPQLEPPAVAIHYPADGQRVHAADAVVASAVDGNGVARMALIVDGRATGQTIEVEGRSAPVVFPLLLRDLEPGAHEIAVRAVDVDGNAATSAATTIEVATQTPTHAGPYERAVRLLDRLAYGPDPAQLALILTLGEKAWLETTMRHPIEQPGDLAALGSACTTFAGTDPDSVTGRTLEHLLLTPAPARARFVMWAENHFSTWIRKIGGDAKWFEHVTFSQLGPATFDRLLFASAESPAMLLYLDQTQSYVGSLNENYAREIMELHTLGVDGGYAQSDVTNLAHLLTGWTASLDGDGQSGGTAALRYTFRFDPKLNDAEGVPVFGMRFGGEETDRFDRAVLAIEHLASHPETAKHIARKLAEHYISVPAPPALVDDLTHEFLSTGGDMTALLGIIADSIVSDDQPYLPRIAQPIDFAVRLYRVSDLDDARAVGSYLSIAGQGLFDRATPDGYPQEDSAYVDSNAIVQRWRLAADVAPALADLVPDPWRESIDAADAWEQAVVDVLALRMTGRVLGGPSNEAALTVLRSTSGPPDARIQAIAPFIAQLPEANLR